jgi:outer membrane lipoprotein carrier protein
MITFLAIISFFLPAVSAQEPSPSDVLEKIRSRYSLINDASATFTQTVKMRFKKTSQQASGTVKIKKGNKYRLDTDQQTIVTDGKTVWMYNPNSRQVLKDRYKQNRQPFSPDKFLLGLPKEFSATNLEKDSQYYVLSLQPAKTSTTSSVITALKIWVNPGTWFFEKIEITDKNNTTTMVTLTNIGFNTGIPDKEFRFEILADMKLVDLTTIQ